MKPTDIEYQRQFRLHDKVTVTTNEGSNFGKIFAISIYGLSIEYENNFNFFDWNEITSICGHGY